MKRPINRTLPEIRLGRKYQIYCDGRDDGLSMQEACDKAEVSRPSGTRWEKARIAGEIAKGKRTGPMTRKELEGIYTDAVRESPPQVVAQIGAALQKLMGFETPQDSAPMQWPSATIAYIDEEHRRLCDRQHACAPVPNTPPGSPNAEAIEFIESPEQNLAKSGGSDDDSHGETK